MDACISRDRSVRTENTFKKSSGSVSVWMWPRSGWLVSCNSCSVRQQQQQQQMTLPGELWLEVELLPHMLLQDKLKMSNSDFNCNKWSGFVIIQIFGEGIIT